MLCESLIESPEVEDWGKDRRGMKYGDVERGRLLLLISSRKVKRGL